MLKSVRDIKETNDESPPVFKSWRTWYTVVLLNLLFLIIIFYVFTKVFE